MSERDYQPDVIDAHYIGECQIEICSDRSVWIDGHPFKKWCQANQNHADAMAGKK